MEEFLASKVHIQPVQPDLLGGFPADVCPHITGQFRCGRSKGGGGGCWNPLRQPKFPISEQDFPSGDILFLPNLPASKKLPEEQIFWGTDPSSAPDYVTQLFHKMIMKSK